MKSIVLCNYTSSENRGCDAIVKSTADLFREYHQGCKLGVHRKVYDSKFGFSDYEEIIYYSELWNKPISRLVSVFFDKVLHRSYLSNWIRQRNIWQSLKRGIALNVGGDTYCYGRHMASLTLNEYCYKNNIPSVFWGFSIDEKAIIDPIIISDLSKYSLLCPREPLSYQLLVKAGIDSKKIYLMSDPAFYLKPKEVKLPPAFQVGNTVGINISPIVKKNGRNPEIVVRNYINLIYYILKNTDMTVALIPHVYVEGNCEHEDLSILSFIKKRFASESRIVLFDEFYTSRELKYIISMCRFLFTARTHASIAGYSSGVPTIVIGYSIKAKGIAKDLFGSFENYVVESQKMQNDDELIKAYFFLQQHEGEIKITLAQKTKEFVERDLAACHEVLMLAK